MLVRTPHDLGALLRDRRKRLGLDQRTLAERIGVSRQWVIDVEKGKPRAEVGLVLLALAAVGIHLRVDEPDGGASRDARSGPDDIDAVIARARKTGTKRHG